MKISIRASVAIGALLTSSGCGDGRDQASYELGQGKADYASWIAEEHGVTNVAEACRRAVRATFANELLEAEVINGEKNPKPHGIDLDDAVAGCVDASK